MSLIYNLQFKTIPEAFNDFGAENLAELLRDREKSMANAYNGFYAQHGIKTKYKGKDFEFKDVLLNMFYTEDQSDDSWHHVVYIKLPKEKNPPSVYCCAYCVAYSTKDDTITFKGLYTVEKSSMHSAVFIGSMGKDGTHYSHRPIILTKNAFLDSEVIKTVGKIAF